MRTTQARAGRLLPMGAGDPHLDSHLQRHGWLPEHQPARLLDAVESSGLTGRGGVAFPVHRKLRAVAQGRRPVLVANGAEGEPASGKDRALLTRAPHLVLDGLQVAAQTVGAARAIAYVQPGPALTSVRRALDERERARTDWLTVQLVAAGEGFVSGQESAVVRALDGGPALPRSIPPRLFEKGVGGRATLVQNVESLAHLALISRYGPTWFREVGTPDEPGTMLCTVSGAVALPGVLEVPLGTPIADVLARGGQATAPLRGLLVGGYHEAWLSAAQAATLRLSAADLAPAGAVPGAGVVIALAQDACPLATSARVVRYLAGQSARQCGLCLNGLPALADTLAVLAGTGWAPDVPARAHQLTALVDGRGACVYPDGTVRPVRSMLATFPDELDAHSRGWCLAGLTARGGGS